MNYLLIAVGGAAGSLARYSAGRAISQKAHSGFPVGTFCINILGALLLGIVSNVHGSTDFYFLLGDGFLGAFTTFSTFMSEGVTLFKGNERMNAIVYIGVSLILGVTGYFLGSFIAGRLSLM